MFCSLIGLLTALQDISSFRMTLLFSGFGMLGHRIILVLNFEDMREEIREILFADLNLHI